MRTLEEILRDTARDLAYLAEHGALFGRGNQIFFEKASTRINDIVTELDDTNMIEVS